MMFEFLYPLCCKNLRVKNLICQLHHELKERFYWVFEAVKEAIR